MKLMVTGRHLTVTPSIRNQIETRLRRIDRLLNDSAISAQCVVTEERGRFTCELTVHARGDHMLRAVGRDTRVASAVSAAAEKLTQQAHKLLGRWKAKRRDLRPPASPAPAETPAPVPVRVIRTRAVAVKPMSVDDAVLALDSSAQAFLVFRHATTEQVAIVYRRPDGHVGLIEPEA